MILYYIEYIDKRNEDPIREWFPTQAKAQSRTKLLRSCHREEYRAVTEPRKVDMPTMKVLTVQWLNAYACHAW